MSEILNYLNRMIPAAILGLVFYFLSRPLRLRRLKGRGEGTSPAHEGFFALFLVLLAGLLWLTVLPKVIWADGRIVFQEEGVGGINLRPFTIFWQSRILAEQGYTNYFLINFWGNIAMFLPIGLFPALLWRKFRWWQAALAGFLLSLSIELLQIPIHRGTDIDDLWLNTLGALLGWLFGWLLSRIGPGFAENCKTRRL